MVDGDLWISYAGWDLDGVPYNDRATTILAAGSDKDPRYFIEMFAGECGERGPLSDIDRQKFIYCLDLWEKKKGRKIETVKDFGAAVTDLRHEHEYELFTSKHTKYIKNRILEGISMERVNELMSQVELNRGFEEAVRMFHEAGVKQVAFSNASHPVAVYFWRRYGMEYGEGIPVIVRAGNTEMVYEPGMHGRKDVVFTGRVAEPEWDKLGPFKAYMERLGVDLGQVAVIDDDHMGILKEVRKKGGVAVGYNVKKKYREAFKSAGIPVIGGEETLEAFPRIIRRWDTISRFAQLG